MARRSLVPAFIVMMLGEHELARPSGWRRGRWSGRIGGFGHGHGAPSLPLTQRSGGRVVQGDLDERGVAGHRLDVLLGPDLDDLGEDRAPLRLVGDDPGGRREVRRDPPLEVEREAWLGFEVEQPGARPLGDRRPADVDAAADAVVDDLDPARLAGAPSRSS